MATNEESDLVREAIALAERGDPDGVRFLYARFAPEVHRILTERSADNGEASVTTERVFAQLGEWIARLRPRPDNFPAWLVELAADFPPPGLPVQGSEAG